jgi:hypothetical protein
MPGLTGTHGQIWLSVAPIDLRRGIDGLPAQAAQTLGQKPLAEKIFAEDFDYLTGRTFKPVFAYAADRGKHYGAIISF